MTARAGLDQQLIEVREQLAALGRRMRELSEQADEQGRADIVDDLSDAQLYLNDANAVLADIIV